MGFGLRAVDGNGRDGEWEWERPVLCLCRRRGSWRTCLASLYGWRVTDGRQMRPGGPDAFSVSCALQHPGSPGDSRIDSMTLPASRVQSLWSLGTLCGSAAWGACLSPLANWNPSQGYTEWQDACG